MQKTSNKITLQEAKESLLRSGYLLEARLETLIRQTSYLVETNISYSDPSTGKSRELDLFAYRCYQAGEKANDVVCAKLLIECVNNPQPLAFLIKEPLAGPPYEALFVRRAGLPMSMDEDSNESLPEFLRMFEYHHYFIGSIATQYCSFAKKQGKDAQWMAFHEPTHFESFYKLSDCVEYFVGKYYEQWTNSPSERIDVRLYYPVLVVQGDLLEVRPRKRSIQLKKVKHIRYRRSAIVGDEETYYQIDVVVEPFFRQFLSIIEGEASETARRMRQNYMKIRRAADSKLGQLRGIGTPGAVRHIMES